MRYDGGSMNEITRGRYCVSTAQTAKDLQEARALRAFCFGLDMRQESEDSECLDSACTHFLVHSIADGRLVCCFRLMPLDGADISQSYSAQFYELSTLQSYDGKMIELGRFCVHPDVNDADIIRVAWGAVTAFVDKNNVKMLFGCSSFAGTETDKYLDVFAMLKTRYLAPARWLPGVKAPSVFRFGSRFSRKPNAKMAMQRIPPLLRTYLLMGGRVSDHAVVDHDMNTLHVFTGLEVGEIPQARKRLLRAVFQKTHS